MSDQDRREGIRALLLYVMHGTYNPDTRWPALEECPFDIVLQVSVRIDAPRIEGPVCVYDAPPVAGAALTAEAYFRLLAEFDLFDAHWALHRSPSLNGNEGAEG